MSFTNPKVFNDVQTFKNGDMAYVETTKGAPNAQGQQFWQWDSISGGDAAAPSVGATSTASAGAVTQRSTSGSSYPTTEERAKTQLYIVRQSSLSNSVALANAVGDKKATATTIIEVAKQFEAFVMGTTPQRAANDYGDITEMDNDIPL